jgi:mannose-1-phosphate guanylyltransferase/mannose-6-phosphate isomerase
MALKYARNGKLVTFGIVPTKPETGYGYIKAGYTNAGGVIPIEKFVEKPELKVAQKYVEQGGYYWNSGMFLFSARKYLKELGFYREDIFEACQLAISAENIDLDFTRINEQAFIQCPDDSIDYAVMEKTTEAVVVPLDAGWSDVGSWSALWDISEKDSHGNATTGDVQVFDTYDTYVRSEKKFIATVGVKDLVISESDDAILIAHKSRVQDVKHIVSDLKIRNRSEANLHRQVYRPWGRYDSIDNGERFQVKRITVKPGEKLSLQKHYHRAEHWIVVHGSALVTKGDKELLLTENQSTYIPVGEIHRLENPGKVDLELIEVQSGSYLGEDDIVRFTDIYGRVS